MAVVNFRFSRQKKSFQVYDAEVDLSGSSGFTGHWTKNTRRTRRTPRSPVPSSFLAMGPPTRSGDPHMLTVTDVAATTGRYKCDVPVCTESRRHSGAPVKTYVCGNTSMSPLALQSGPIVLRALL